VLVHNASGYAPTAPSPARQIIQRGLARAGMAALGGPLGKIAAGGMAVWTAWELIQFARKGDIKEIDDIVNEHGMNREQRRELHDEMAKIKQRGDKLSREEIEEIAREIMRRHNSKPRW